MVTVNDQNKHVRLTNTDEKRTCRQQYWSWSCQRETTTQTQETHRVKETHRETSGVRQPEHTLTTVHSKTQCPKSKQHHSISDNKLQNKGNIWSITATIQQIIIKNIQNGRRLRCATIIASGIHPKIYKIRFNFTQMLECESFTTLRDGARAKDQAEGRPPSSFSSQSHHTINHTTQSLELSIKTHLRIIKHYFWIKNPQV